MTEDQNRTLQDKFMLRFPEGMRERIKDLADLNDRSMNAEIVQRLRQSIEDDRGGVLRIDLPVEVWNDLMADAGIHQVSIPKRAEEIIAGSFNATSDLGRALDYVRRTAEDLANAQERASEFRDKSDTDFILYYNKIVQMRHFAQNVLSEAGISDQLRSTAEDIGRLTQTEFETLSFRHEIAAASHDQHQEKN